MSETNIICISGPDGSGKTTQITKLAEYFSFEKKLKVAAVTIWDMLLDPNFRELIGFKSSEQVSALLKSLDQKARCLFLFQCMQQGLALGLAKKPDICLVNAYWYKYFATEVAHGGDATAMKNIAEITFPEPAQTFYLNLSPEQSYIRKGESLLSSYETGFAKEKNEAAFIEFQQIAHRELQQLKQEKNWVTIDGSQNADKISQAIISQIKF